MGIVFLICMPWRKQKKMSRNQYCETLYTIFKNRRIAGCKYQNKEHNLFTLRGTEAGLLFWWTADYPLNQFTLDVKCCKFKMEIYHERQRQMLCAVHTLNNLFQDRSAYSKADLDAISYNLSPDAFVNPHKNMLGLGNYDVNVLMAALQLKDYEAVWFDKRLSLETLELHQIFGFVVNKPSNVNLVWLEVPIKRPHWFAVRKLNNNYYNLDSKLSSPECIGNEEKLVTFLTELLSLPAVQLFIIVDKSVAENSLWKRL